MYAIEEFLPLFLGVYGFVDDDLAGAPPDLTALELCARPLQPAAVRSRSSITSWATFGAPFMSSITW
jgi:hypothetical protein